MKCNHCGSKNIETDCAKGSSYCLGCGFVVDEVNIVSDITFDNTKVVGTFVSNLQGGSSFLKNKHGNYICDSKHSRMNKAYQEISNIADKLSKVFFKKDINSYIVERAKKCYLIAAENKFLQGRKTKLIVGIILYSICRQEKTMHLLIDFSEVLQTNLYVLGNLYLKIIHLLNLKIPHIDPSLFIQRFCNKLKFGDQTNNIANLALKILQSMKRNWLHIGRRPNGLCGAAIMIAASCYDKSKTIDEIIEIVHVCNGTIKKRVQEFSNTSTSNITKHDLETNNNLNLNEGDSMDPPSFIANRLKDLKSFEPEVLKKFNEIEKAMNKKLASLHGKKEMENIQIVFKKTTDKIDPRKYILEKEIDDVYGIVKEKNLRKLKKEAKNKSKYCNSSINASNTETTDTYNKNSSRNSSKSNLSKKSSNISVNSAGSNTSLNTQDLSDFEDNEVDLYLLSNEEQKLKKHLWEAMYSDWIEEQEAKINDKIDKNKKNETFKIDKNSSDINVKYEIPNNKINIKETKLDPVEAIRSSKRFNKTIKNSNLTKLFS